MGKKQTPLVFLLPKLKSYQENFSSSSTFMSYFFGSLLGKARNIHGANADMVNHSEMTISVPFSCDPKSLDQEKAPQNWIPCYLSYAFLPSSSFHFRFFPEFTRVGITNSWSNLKGYCYDIMKRNVILFFSRNLCNMTFVLNYNILYFAFYYAFLWLKSVVTWYRDSFNYTIKTFSQLILYYIYIATWQVVKFITRICKILNINFSIPAIF